MISPICLHLSDKIKDDFMLNVNRASSSVKITGLIDESENIFDEIKHLAYLNRLPYKFTHEKIA